MKNRSWLYAILIMLAVVSFPIVLFGSAALGLALDFSTTWGSNFQDESVYMLVLPSIVLIAYGYGLYWLLNKRQAHIKKTIITEHEGRLDSNRIISALQSSPNMSLSDLCNATGMSAQMMQQELQKLQNSALVTRVVMLDKEFYTLVRN